MPRVLPPVLFGLLFACGCQSTRYQAGLYNPSWEVQYEDTTSLFVGLSIVDATTVWVSGSPGVVGRTTDGGETWTMLDAPGPDSLQFRDVHAFSDQEAFILSIGPGEDSRIYHTTDGGASWTLSFQNEDPNAFFDCFSFWDRQRGFAFSDSHDGEFTLIRTMDGGATWQRIDPALVPDARDGEGSFAASGTCVETQPGGLGWFGTGASSVDTRVIRTADYGESWTEAITPIESTAGDEGITSVLFWDGQNGIAFGSPSTRETENVAITSDGGATWRSTGATVLGGQVYGASMVPGVLRPTLVAVSPSGSAFSADNGTTWTTFDGFEYWTTAFYSPTVGWAAGRGRISRMVSRSND
ncbi:MAG: oxidoreductase [Bacteroidetes bacterium]|nr:oxidoreductase [Bacteroidota bacterium]